MKAHHLFYTLTVVLAVSAMVVMPVFAAPAQEVVPAPAEAVVESVVQAASADVVAQSVLTETAAEGCDWFASSPQTATGRLQYNGERYGYDSYTATGSGPIVGAVFYKNGCPYSIPDGKSFLLGQGYTHYRIRELYTYDGLIVSPLLPLPVEVVQPAPQPTRAPQPAPAPQPVPKHTCEWWQWWCR